MQGDGRFGRQSPAILRRDGRGSRSAVARRFARPENFPFQTERWREQRLRYRTQIAVPAKIHNQQSVVAIVVTKITQNKARWSEHCAVHSLRLLIAEARVFASKFQKIDMQRVELLVLFPLGEIEFATDKNSRIGWDWQALLNFPGGERWKLRQKGEASFANRFLHRSVANIREE